MASESTLVERKIRALTFVLSAEHGYGTSIGSGQS
jgi:hypothetical protein